MKVLGATDGAELLTFPFDEDSPRHLAWSADRRRLAAATENGTVHVWDAGRGYEFSADGSRRDELAWAYYGRTLADGGGVDRTALQEFLRLVPDTLGFWEARGRAHATLGEYEQAAQEFAKAIMHLSYEPAWNRALALLGTRDLDAYHGACASLVEQFRDSDVPSNRRYVAWLCALSPNPPGDSTTVLQVARALHDHQTTREYGDKHVLTIGASLFRNGQYAAAVGTLTTLADKLNRGGDATDRFELACAQYFIALARHQQGHDFQARRYLAEATRHSVEFHQTAPSSQIPRWGNTVVLDSLRRETEAALNNP